MGSRKLAQILRTFEQRINQKRMQRLMKLMAIRSISLGHNTRKMHLQHKVSPYLLNERSIDQSNQVCATNISYLPMSQGVLYLVAIINWYSRRVLS